MEIKELKKEIDGLSNINKALLGFKKSWLKKIKANSNQEFPFLQELDERVKGEINNYLVSYQKIFGELKYAQFINEKLSSLAHYLIELKLTSLNGDKVKPKILVKKFVNDDFLNLRQLVDEVNQFGFNLDSLKEVYDQVNGKVLENVSLEPSVVLMDAPHKEYLSSLFLICRKQKRLLKSLGKEFISLTKEMKRKKKL